jgi:hypothetical protein
LIYGILSKSIIERKTLMKRIKKYIVLLLTIAIYLSGMAVTAFAAPAPDDGTQVVTRQDPAVDGPAQQVAAQQVTAKVKLKRYQQK